MKVLSGKMICSPFPGMSLYSHFPTLTLRGPLLRQRRSSEYLFVSRETERRRGVPDGERVNLCCKLSNAFGKKSLRPVFFERFAVCGTPAATGRRIRKLFLGFGLETQKRSGLHEKWTKGPVCKAWPGLHWQIVSRETSFSFTEDCDIINRRTAQAIFRAAKDRQAGVLPWEISARCLPGQL